MIPVTGLFAKKGDALRAREALNSSGIAQERINVLMPNGKQASVRNVPVSDAEQPGMGKVMGGVVGGTVGAAAGAELAALGAALLVPGVGPILAIGSAAAAILGLGGAITGAALGEALDESLTDGLPVDELFVYEDALRQGRSVVIVFAASQKQAIAIRQLLSAHGAETIDSARQSWWLGIRDDEQASFSVPDGTMVSGEHEFRQGFEAALKPRFRGKNYEEVREGLKHDSPHSFGGDLFRRGYERGRAYLSRWQGRS
jgi:outer membrane lipoprotein SlyB